MDSLFWDVNWTEIKTEEWLPKEQNILQQDKWIIEGYIDGNHIDRLKNSDLIIYLDLSGHICAFNGLKRWWKFRTQPRPEMASGCTDKLDLRYIWTMFTRKERPEIERALSTIALEKIIRIRSLKDIKIYLNSL